MRKAVIFDIDGTLAKISKNEDGTPKREYSDYDKVDLDEPVIEICETILAECLLGLQDTIIFITGRKEKCFRKTLEWLANHIKYLRQESKKEYVNHYFGGDEQGFKMGQEFNIRKTDFGLYQCKGVIFMRPNDDKRPEIELKKEIYETKIKGNYDVVMAFDDDAEVCKMYKEQGILTMQVMTKGLDFIDCDK